MRSLILAAVLVLSCGCVQRGLYQREGEGVTPTVDWTLSDAEMESVWLEVTKDLVTNGFGHGIPPFWHLRVRPAEAYRNEFVYVVPLLSFHTADVTIGNLVCWRLTDAPVSHDLVRDWPWSGDTNLMVVWQNRHAYYGVLDGDEVVIYRDYVGSLFWLPITRLFTSPREVARVKRTSPAPSGA